MDHTGQVEPFFKIRIIPHSIHHNDNEAGIEKLSDKSATMITLSLIIL